jgi:hypothetical protein
MVSSFHDTLPSSLLDSNVSLKWKHRKNKELGHALWLVALWGYKGMLEIWGESKKNDKQSPTHTDLQKIKQVG